jgi:hypothetical protein
MSSNLKWFFGGVGLLIFVGLLLSYGDAAQKLIGTLADAGIKGTAALQMRPVKGVTF